MSEVLKIEELIAQIQRNASRRQRIEETYFSIPREQIHLMETNITRRAQEKVHSIDQLLSAGSLEEKTRALSIHGAVKETAIKGSKNALIRLYKKIMFTLLKPLLTHQQEFNAITGQILQQQLTISKQYGEIIKDSLLALTKYNVEILKGIIRSTTLLMNEISQQLEKLSDSVSNNTTRLTEIKNQIENTRRRLRIGLIHLHNSDLKLTGRIGHIEEKYESLIKEIEDLKQKEKLIESIRRRLRIGLIHLNNLLKRDTQLNRADIQETKEQYLELSRRLSELSINISDQLQNMIQQKKKDIDQRGKTKTGLHRTSLYDDPLFFDLQKFEEYVRGEEELDHFQNYVDVFRGRKNVLDAGCGAGIFLQLLKENGIGAYGVDVDSKCIKECKKKNLNAIKADIVEHLRSLPDRSLDGFFAAQVIEHMEFDYLLEMLRLAFLKLSPGSPLVLETVNTTCLTIYSGSFYADPTHIRPVHPVTLQFVLQRIGYRDIEIRFINPFPEEEKLQLISTLTIDNKGNGNELSQIARIIDENCQKLNAILFSYKDYAIFAQKP